ncbi:hypothetical protein ACFCZQ_35980 [Streptomyces virginiae]|uniref:hypothetical protein n=1 Tax=Streptomyces virginiae TaxID=1961 RepID=UPI0035DDF939
MGLSGFLTGSRNLARATARWIAQTPARTRRALIRADHWVQDHIALTTTCALITVLAVTGLTLHYWGETLLPLAKEYQPLLTIVWIVISALVLVVKFFSTRRAARLAPAAPLSTTTATPPAAPADQAIAPADQVPTADTTGIGGSRVR